MPLTVGGGVTHLTSKHIQTIITSVLKVDNVIPTRVRVKPPFGDVRGWSN